mmetsp:Transcript_49680/g.116335  ORF Transcript_49680/g.116335 Transcript_49680/m.116335 type:complete len:164 (+) Transcript_49680:25-516(+)
MALLNAPFRSTLLVALVGAALLACSSMLRAGSGFASMPMNIKELLADDERALPPPPPSAAAVAAALLPSTSRAPGTADAHSDNAVLLSAREAGDIHRRYGKIFRPWGKGMLGAKSYRSTRFISLRQGGWVCLRTTPRSCGTGAATWSRTGWTTKTVASLNGRG